MATNVVKIEGLGELKFRASFPAHEYHDLPKLMGALVREGQINIESAMELLARCTVSLDVTEGVEAANAAGDTARAEMLSVLAASTGDPKAWGNLDIFEVAMLANKLAEYLSARVRTVEAIFPKS